MAAAGAVVGTASGTAAAASTAAALAAHGDYANAIAVDGEIAAANRPAPRDRLGRRRQRNPGRRGDGHGLGRSARPRGAGRFGGRALPNGDRTGAPGIRAGRAGGAAPEDGDRGRRTGAVSAGDRAPAGDHAASRRLPRAASRSRTCSPSIRRARRGSSITAGRAGDAVAMLNTVVAEQLGAGDEDRRQPLSIGAARRR